MEYSYASQVCDIYIYIYIYSHGIFIDSDNFGWYKMTVDQINQNHFKQVYRMFDYRGFLLTALMTGSSLLELITPITLTTGDSPPESL